MNHRTRHTTNIGGIEVIVREEDTFNALIGTLDFGDYRRAEATVSNDKQYPPQEISYDFYDRVTINSDLSLRPGHNQIEVRLYRNGSSPDAIGTIDVNLDGRLYTSKGIEFLLEKTGKHVSDPALDEVAELITEMNQYLSSPIEQAFVHDKETPGGTVINGTINLSRYNWEKPKGTPNATAWHELAHLFYNELRGSTTEYLRNNQWKPYGEEFEALFQRAVDMSLVEGGDKINRRWKDIKPNSVMAIFNSHHYSDGNLEFGHPQNHGGELFAYGSEILRYHPDQFKGRVKQLDTQREKQLPLQIAGKIASAYVTHKNCPSRLDMMREFVQ